MHPVRARRVTLLLLLALVAGCMSAPFAAQSPPRAARIGFLGGGSPGGPLAAAFVAGLGEHGWVEGQNLTVQRPPPSRQSDPHPPPVLHAHAALDQPLLLQPPDEPRQRALAEMDPARDVLHPAPLAPGGGVRRGGLLGDEDVEHLEVAGAQAVRMQHPVDLAHRARMRRQDVPPLVRQSRTGLVRYHAPHVNAYA